MNEELKKVNLISKPRFGQIIKCYTGIDEYFVGVCVGLIYDEMINCNGEKYLKQKARVKHTYKDDGNYDFYFSNNSYKFEV